jgi:hypothetical protein
VTAAHSELRRFSTIKDYECGASIGVLSAETAVVEDNILAVDVVAEAKPTESKTPLAFASRHVGKFLDVVRPRPVRGVLAQNLKGTLMGCVELRLALSQ